MGIHHMFQLPPWHASLGGFAFLYVGPDAILPLASAVAAVVGVLLLFWRYVVGLVRRTFRLFREKVSQAFSKNN